MNTQRNYDLDKFNLVMVHPWAGVHYVLIDWEYDCVSVFGGMKKKNLEKTPFGKGK